MSIPRQYSLVKLDPDNPVARNDSLELGVMYVFLGEIPNMVGHCVVINHKTCQIYTGFHTEDFIELTDDEV